MDEKKTKKNSSPSETIIHNDQLELYRYMRSVCDDRYALKKEMWEIDRDLRTKMHDEYVTKNTFSSIKNMDENKTYMTEEEKQAFFDKVNENKCMEIKKGLDPVTLLHFQQGIQSLGEEVINKLEEMKSKLESKIDRQAIYIIVFGIFSAFLWILK